MAHGVHYFLGDKIATGSVAETWTGESELASGFRKRIHFCRAIARLANDPNVASAFADAGFAAMALQHESAVRLVSAGTIDGAPCWITESVEGVTLAHLLAATPDERLPPPTALWVARLCCDALSAVRFAGIPSRKPVQCIAHGEVEPRTIWITKRGELKLADVGLGQAVEDALMVPDPEYDPLVYRDPAYKSPDPFFGRPTGPRSDVFSLGLVLWRMLTGVPIAGPPRPPESGSQGPLVHVEIFRGQLEPPSARIRDIPPHIDELVMSALAHQPDGRPESAAAFGASIDRALDRLGDAAAPRELADRVARVYREPQPARQAVTFEPALQLRRFSGLPPGWEGEGLGPDERPPGLPDGGRRHCIDYRCPLDTPGLRHILVEPPDPPSNPQPGVWYGPHPKDMQSIARFVRESAGGFTRVGIDYHAVPPPIPCFGMTVRLSDGKRDVTLTLTDEIGFVRGDRRDDEALLRAVYENRLPRLWGLRRRLINLPNSHTAIYAFSVDAQPPASALLYFGLGRLQFCFWSDSLLAQAEIVEVSSILSVRDLPQFHGGIGPG